MVAPNIERTYQFVRRELPDGTVQFHPAVKGMITYTKEFRNFSVVWKDDHADRRASRQASCSTFRCSERGTSNDLPFVF
jgi:hypothetical protein